MRLNSPLTMWLLVILGGAALLALLPARQLWEMRPQIVVLGAIAWIILAGWAFSAHRNAPRATASIDRLVTSGPYRYVRHPFYAADILLSITLVLGAGRLDIIAASLLAIVIFLAWTAVEERALRKRFPAYAAYAERTGRIFPRLR